MLELFAVRGQLAVSVLVHVTLAAAAWIATVLAAERARTAQGPASIRSQVMQDRWDRVRILVPITAVSGFLIAAQICIFWQSALSVAGATLIVPLVCAILASIGRAVWVYRTPTPTMAATRGAALLGTLSGVASLTALAWLSHPAGAEIAHEGSLTASAFAAFTSPHGWMRVASTGLAATTLGATFFAAGAARREHDFGLSTTVRTALLALSLQAVVGLATLRSIAQFEPVKLAAMAAQWDDRPNAPMQVGAWPYDFGEKTNPGKRLPVSLSTLVHGDSSAVVQGLLATPMEDRPPVAALYISIQVKVLTSLLAWLVLLGGTVQVARGKRPRRLLAWVATPLVLFNWTLGWLIAEVGRSPWTIRGALRVGQATWLPYGMTPTALLWCIAAVTLAVVAYRSCRRLDPEPDAPEPSSMATE